MAVLKIRQIDNEIIEINGMRYTHKLFESFAEGGINYNVPFVITKREDGVVTIKKYDEFDNLILKELEKIG